MNWTEQQQQAIACRSRRTLVSAAAGSGKTAVLVERVFRRLTDEKKTMRYFPFSDCHIYKCRGR